MPSQSPSRLLSLGTAVKDGAHYTQVTEAPVGLQQLQHISVQHDASVAEDVEEQGPLNPRNQRAAQAASGPRHEVKGMPRARRRRPCARGLCIGSRCSPGRGEARLVLGNGIGRRGSDQLRSEGSSSSHFHRPISWKSSRPCCSQVHALPLLDTGASQRGRATPGPFVEYRFMLAKP